MTSSEDINIKEIIDSVIEKAVDIIQNKRFYIALSTKEIT
jgi:diacylglycerol kinase